MQGEASVEAEMKLARACWNDRLACWLSFPSVPLPRPAQTQSQGFEELKRLCDQDYDLVFTTSFGFMSQTADVSSAYPPCLTASDGSPHPTHFVHATGHITNPQMSAMFGKAYQMKYLAGMVAGDALAAPRGSSMATARGGSCVGYVRPQGSKLHTTNTATTRNCTPPPTPPLVPLATPELCPSHLMGLIHTSSRPCRSPPSPSLRCSGTSTPSPSAASRASLSASSKWSSSALGTTRPPRRRPRSTFGRRRAAISSRRAPTHWVH